jgi:transposase
LEPHLVKLGAQWDAGCHNGAELWRCLRADGFKVGLRVVTKWAIRRRRLEKGGLARPGAPPARKLSHLMTTQREQLTKAEAVTVAKIETNVPALAAARALLDRFHRMLRTHDSVALTSWIADSETILLSSFCKGITADLAAAKAVLTERWSNGQTEGQITRLKLVKRQMYGRPRLDLLRARLVGAT